jgi:hypothetical protein
MAVQNYEMNYGNYDQYNGTGKFLFLQSRLYGWAVNSPLYGRFPDTIFGTLRKVCWVWWEPRRSDGPQQL